MVDITDSASSDAYERQVKFLNGSKDTVIYGGWLSACIGKNKDGTWVDRYIALNNVYIAAYMIDKRSKRMSHHPAAPGTDEQIAKMMAAAASMFPAATGEAEEEEEDPMSITDISKLMLDLAFIQAQDACTSIKNGKVIADESNDREFIIKKSRRRGDLLIRLRAHDRKHREKWMQMIQHQLDLIKSGEIEKIVSGERTTLQKIRSSFYRASTHNAKQQLATHSNTSLLNLDTSPSDTMSPVSEKEKTKLRLSRFLLSRPNVDSLKTKGILTPVENPVFGGNLIHLMISANDIPTPIKVLIEEIERRGLNHAGLYRLNGNAGSIQNLKSLFNTGQSINFEDDKWMDINILTGTVKLFLRELSIPLVPFEFFDEFLANSKLPDGPAKLSAFRALVKRLPNEHYTVLKYLLTHLQKVLTFSDENKMKSENLAICFGPSVIRPRVEDINTLINLGHQNGAMEYLILNTNFIFSELDESGSSGDGEETNV